MNGQAEPIGEEAPPIWAEFGDGTLDIYTDRDHTEPGYNVPIPGPGEAITAAPFGPGLLMWVASNLTGHTVIFTTKPHWDPRLGVFVGDDCYWFHAFNSETNDPLFHSSWAF